MKNERDFLNRILLGNESAVAYCEMIFFVSQVWDDLIDGDEVTPPKINKAFHNLLVGIPLNNFYRQWCDLLTPMMNVFISDWLDANQFEKSRPEVSYVLRDSVSALAIQCAFIIGGYNHMIEISKEVRDWVFDEDFELYKVGLIDG